MMGMDVANIKEIRFDINMEWLKINDAPQTSKPFHSLRQTEAFDCGPSESTLTKMQPLDGSPFRSLLAKGS